MKANSRRFRANAIVATIRDQGRSVSWLARRLGVSRQYTSDVVHGHIVVGEPMAKRIADTLGVPFFLLWNLHDGKSGRRDGKFDEEVAA